MGEGMDELTGWCKVNGKPLKGFKMRSGGSGVEVGKFEQYVGDN